MDFLLGASIELNVQKLIAQNAFLAALLLAHVKELDEAEQAALSKLAANLPTPEQLKKMEDQEAEITQLNDRFSKLFGVPK